MGLMELRMFLLLYEKLNHASFHAKRFAAVEYIN